jgi:hypothetical protein
MILDPGLLWCALLRRMHVSLVTVAFQSEFGAILLFILCDKIIQLPLHQLVAPL